MGQSYDCVDCVRLIPVLLFPVLHFQRPRYTPYTHMDRSLTRCPCWPASTANQIGPVTLTFDHESGIRVTCDVVYLCSNFSLPGPLRSRLKRDGRDRRQTDVRQHHRLMPLGGGIINQGSGVTLSYPAIPAPSCVS